MENMAIDILKSYKNKRVFVTGHTGFKGSWLVKTLNLFGVTTKGYSLPPDTKPNHFSLLDIDIESQIGDIRNYDNLMSSIQEFQPDIIFHLAAQPLVRRSYRDPIETYSTNIMGTVNLLEAARKTSSVKAIINVTTDKCYENKEWYWGYRENDRLGGHDPYSSSKACSELVTRSFKNSFFNINDYNKTHQCLIASARAGNVIGGGDWAEDRLIPDLIRSIDSEDSLIIRSPKATRPWQHVLEPIVGYLMLGQKLLDGKTAFADAWNFGPTHESSKPVENLVKEIRKYLPHIKTTLNSSQTHLHEANLLHLDSTKAFKQLKWKPLWDYQKSIEITATWYKSYLKDKEVNTVNNIKEYLGI